jgi:hypothetical protein
MARMPDGKYRFIVQPAVEITRTDDYESDLQVNTQRFTKIVEDMVRQYPDQWFWIHQRWKTKPWSRSFLGITLCPLRMTDPNSPRTRRTINPGAGKNEGL